MLKVNNNKTPEDINVVLVPLLLTLNTFHTFFYCFYCWLWTGKYLLGSYAHLEKILNKSFRAVKLQLE